MIRRRWLTMLLTLPMAARAADAAPFVLGTDQPETTMFGRYYRRVYAEAFRRLGLRVQVVQAPTQRLSVLLAQGDIDGEVARARAYGEAHPELVRVDESVLETAFTLFTAQPALSLKRIEDLPATALRGVYRRGVVYCERTLGPLLPAARFTDVTDVAQGLNMLLAGRADFYCDVDAAVSIELEGGALKDAGAIRRLLDLQVASIYPYLHGKHSALAPRLAAVLKQMRADGLLERYRQEAQQK